MSSQFLTMPWSIGCVTWRYVRCAAASSPIMMSRISEAVVRRSSARRMGRPTMDGKTEKCGELPRWCGIAVTYRVRGSLSPHSRL